MTSSAISRYLISKAYKNEFYSIDSNLFQQENTSFKYNKECILKDFFHFFYFTDNCLLTSNYFIQSLGFETLYYSGVETGNKYIASKVLASNNVIIEVVSSLDYSQAFLTKDNPCYFMLLNLFCRDFLSKHGAGIGMVSFKTDNKNLNQIIDKLSLDVNHKIWNFNGSWKKIVVEVLGTNIYQLILSDLENHFESYTEYFKSKDMEKSILKKGFLRIDHIVINVPRGDLESTAQNFQNLYEMFDFWKPDAPIKTTKTGLNTKVLSSFVKKKSNAFHVIEEGVKLAINEPLVVDSSYQGQIEDFLKYNNGAGVQHIAFICEDIIDTVEKLAQMGKVSFLTISSYSFESYYAKVWSLLLQCQANENRDDKDLLNFVNHLLKNFEKIKQLNILVEINSENKILLQIFTAPLNDKPALFFEFIQRFRNQGFGEGNFNSLFKSIEENQKKRGTM